MNLGCQMTKKRSEMGSKDMSLGKDKNKLRICASSCSKSLSC